jgi:hypothetical protein
MSQLDERGTVDKSEAGATEGDDTSAESHSLEPDFWPEIISG